MMEDESWKTSEFSLQKGRKVYASMIVRKRVTWGHDELLQPLVKRNISFQSDKF